MKTRKSTNVRFSIMLLLSLAIMSCAGPAGQASFKPAGTPLKISIDTSGQLQLSIERGIQIPTPLGTFEVGIIVDPTEYFHVQNTLTVRVDGKDHIYDLHGDKFDVEFDPGNYKKITLTPSNNNNILLELVKAHPKVPGELILAWVNEINAFQIYTMHPDGKNLKQLTTEGENRNSQWSPDGSMILFESTRNGNNEIYIMNEDGLEQTNLTNDNGYDAAPSWSPDGSKISYESDASGNPDIWIMNADGRGKVNLTAKFPARDYYQVWSRDGQRIAFVSERDGLRELYVMNSDGSNQTKLTNNTFGNHGPRGLIWSYDNQVICFEASENGQFHLWSINVDGSNLEFQARYGDKCPDWRKDFSYSPDGQYKVYLGGNEQGMPQVFVSRADGSDPVRLTHDNLSWQAPRWRP